MNDADVARLRAEIAVLDTKMVARQTQIKEYEQFNKQIRDLENCKADMLADRSYARVKTRNQEYWMSATMADQILSVIDVEIDRCKADQAALDGSSDPV